MRALTSFLLAIVIVSTAPAASLAAPGSPAGTPDALISVGTTEGRPTLHASPTSGLKVDADVARLVVPNGLPQEWRFLGPVGAERFQLPGAGGPGTPRLAIASTAAPGDQTTALTVRVSGPGDVIAFTGGSGEEPVETLIDTSTDPAPVVEIAPGESLRPTWIFTAPGTHTLELTPSTGTHVGSPLRYDIEVVGAATGPGAAATTREPCLGAEVPADVDVVDDGHFDFGVLVVDGTLVSRVKDDRADPPAWARPSATLFRIDDAAALEVPADPAFRFLGEPGAAVWNIGQTQQAGVPWLGWNTQHPSAVSEIRGGTQWRLDDVTGPGELFVHQTGSFGALTKVLGTGDGWPRTLTIPANTHGHANWSFTEPGVYRVTTTHSATLRDGRSVSSQETLTFLVGPCATAPPKPAADLPADLLLDDTGLVSGNRNGVTASPAVVESGDTLSVTLPGATAGAWFMPVFYSTPQQTSWKAAGETEALTAVRVPALSPGAHKVAVHDADGSLVGWAPITVTSAAPIVPDVPDAPDGDGDEDVDDAPAGGSTPDTDGSDGVGAPVPGAMAPSGSPGAAAQVCVPTGPTAGPGDTADRGTPGGGARDDSPGAADASVVTTGHFDFGSQIRSSQLVPRVKDDRTQPPRWVSPTAFVFALGTKAEQKIPAGSSYSFLGAAGSTVWLMPQTQVEGVPWLGWNTQDESVRSGVEGDVTFTLDDVSGPGELGIYLTDSFGGVGEKKLGTIDGFPRSFEVPLNVHAHGNWAFTAAGTYRVSITQSATLSSGKRVSAPAVLTFRVGSGATVSRSGTSSGSGDVSATTVASTTPSPASTGSGKPSAASGPTCTLPATGAPDIAWLLGFGVLLLAVGIVIATVATTSRARATA